MKGYVVFERPQGQFRRKWGKRSERVSGLDRIRLRFTPSRFNVIVVNIIINRRKVEGTYFIGSFKAC